MLDIGYDADKVHRVPNSTSLQKSLKKAQPIRFRHSEA